MKLFLCLILVAPIFSLAQQEGNIWYFGDKAGIDFSSGTPVALTNSSMHSVEGCATICDNTGNLLFYTESTSIWNKNHVLMPNGSGLFGDNSTAEGSIIIPKPGSTTIYYVFTLDHGGNLDGFRYSEVDMSLQAGLGDVTANKNISILTPVTEHVAAVKHQNGTDFWVIVHHYGSNAFHSYLLTSTGLNTTPVITNVGTTINTTSGTVGQMKISSDGSKLALVAGNYFELFDFNNATGVVNNAMTFNPGFPQIYGVEFSPNGNALYVTNG